MTMPENSVPGVMVLIGAILVAVGIAALGSCVVMRPRDVPEMLALVGIAAYLLAPWSERQEADEEQE